MGAAGDQMPLQFDEAHPCLYGSIEETTIFLKTTKTIAVDVKTSDTIKNIKARFRQIEVASDEAPEMELAGRRLEDGRALMEYHVRRNSTLDVIRPERPVLMRVFVRLPAAGKHIMLEVTSTDTVHDVKVRIHRREGVPPERQTLVFAGRPLEDGQRSLSACNVRGGSTLLAIFRPRDRGIRIFVESEAGVTTTVDVKGWYTVRDVQALGESALGVPQDRRRRVYHGERLLEDHWTMADCAVRTGTIIRMCLDRGREDEYALADNGAEAEPDEVPLGEATAEGVLAATGEEAELGGGGGATEQGRVWAGERVDEGSTIGGP